MDYNKCIFVGKVNGQPQISTDANGNKQAVINFVINDRVQQSDGQWSNRPMEITVYTQGKQAGVIEQYVKPGHELLLECQYKNWKDANGTLKHAFKLISLTLGYSPRQETPQQPAAQQGFPM